LKYFEIFSFAAFGQKGEDENELRIIWIFVIIICIEHFTVPFYSVVDN
jgi:hypothetical protein